MTEMFTYIRIGPAIILIALDNSKADDENLAATIRRADGAAGRVPILDWSAGATHSPDVDEIVPRPCAPEVLIAACERWRPERLPDAFARLQGAFGDAEASGLLDRFRQQLLDALDALAMERPCDLAHRVAGMAGMLGFTALGRQWLRLSEGESVDRISLRYATRRAVVAIDQAFSAG